MLVLASAKAMIAELGCIRLAHYWLHPPNTCWAQSEDQRSCAERSAGPDAALADTLAAERVRLGEVSRDFRLFMDAGPSDWSRATCSPQSGNELLAGFGMSTERPAPNQSLLPTTVVVDSRDAERLAGRGRVLRSAKNMGGCAA